MKNGWVLSLCVLALACGSQKKSKESNNSDPSSDLIVNELPDIEITTDGPATLEVEVPADVMSFMVVIAGPVDAWLDVQTVTDPDGELIWDVNQCLDACVLLTNFKTNYGSTLVVMFPMAPEVPIKTGTYELALVNVNEPGQNVDATVTTIAKPGGEPASTVTLDVTYHFVALDDFSAAAAPTDPDFVVFHETALEHLARAGVVIGDIAYEDLDRPDLSTIDTADTADSEVNDLFALAPDGRRLHIFLVDELVGTVGDGVTPRAGMAGTIPGPATLGETGASGIVLTAFDLRDQPWVDGYVAAHEIMHFLGLFHTSEATGDSHDPIGDTPECTLAQDLDEDQVVSRDECAQFGAGNNMFWRRPSAQTDVTLSAGQSYVVRHNPLVR